MKKNGALIFTVDADHHVRYERVVGRGSDLDKVTFGEFVEQEDREMGATDAWDMNVFGVMQMADYTLTNNGSLEELHAQVDEVLVKISN